MLAARDQENRVFSHQAGTTKPLGQGPKQLQAKTPAARYPKTPLKVPFNDENAATVMGKSVLADRTKLQENMRTIGKGGKGVDKSAFATPLEPRTGRAPLGNKTTNAKARTGQVQGVKDMVREFEKSVPPATISRRPRPKSPRVQSSKLEVHADQAGPLGGEEDIEYAPPKPKDIQYQSDVLPDGALTFEGLKPENRLKGYYEYYYDPVGDDGVSLKERQFAEAQKRAFEEGEKRIKEDLDEFDWTVGDVPETARGFQRKKPQPTVKPAHPQSRQAVPSTIASRNAASTLALAPKTAAAGLKPTTAKPAPKLAGPLPFGQPARKPAQPAAVVARSRDLAADNGVTASRNTLGYTKGRTASSLLGNHGAINPTTTSGAAAVGIPRSTSSASSRSAEMTITPARFAQSQAAAAQKEAEDLKRFGFLSIFDVDEEEDGDLGGSPEMIPDASADDDFKLTVDF